MTSHRRNLILGLMLCGGILFASAVQAQPIDKWTLRIYLAGASAPLSAPVDLLRAAVVCDQAAPPTMPPVNPTKVVFDDPDNAGKVCIWTDPGTGPLLTVPFGMGAYEGTLTATNSAGASAETARVPFTRPGILPGVPSGLRFVR